MPERLITAKTLSKLIDVKPTTLLRWAKEGKIPAYVMGRKIFFDPQEVIQAIKNRPLLTDLEIKRILDTLIKQEV